MNMSQTLEIPGHLLQVQRLTSADVTPELTKEIADFFRYIFANAYGQYAFFPSEGKALTTEEVLGESEGYVSLQELDGLKNFPLHPETEEEAIFWHDPEVTLKRMREKFQKQAHLVLLRKQENEQLVGMTFGYEATLKDSFHHEEWHNPHHYSRLETSPFLRDYATFENAINEAMAGNRERFGSVLGNKNAVDADTITYVWNCIALAPRITGRGTGGILASTFFQWISEQTDPNVLQLAEVIPGSTAHGMLTKGGAIEVPGALGEANPIGLVITPLSKLILEANKKRLK